MREFRELYLEKGCWDKFISVIELNIKGLLCSLVMDVSFGHILFHLGHKIECFDVGIISKPWS